MAFCSNCGTKLNERAKFCFKCGQKIQQSEIETGMVVCPNCGNKIEHHEAVCEYCGYRLVNKEASSSVKELANKLYEIDREGQLLKKGKLADILNGERIKATDTTTERKITLIKNFPIPNTVEEITEFMILADSNIDIRLSKKKIGYKIKRTPSFSGQNNPLYLSDAWVSKMRQIYKKAEFSFGNSSDFQLIKEIYSNKMRELNMDLGE